MESLIVTKEQMEERDYLNGLAELMSNDKFRSFLREYGEDWSSIKMIVMMVKMYQFIEETYFEKVGEHCDPKQITNLIKMIWTKSEGQNIRKMMIDGIEKFENGQKFDYELKNSLSIYFGNAIEESRKNN